MSGRMIRGALVAVTLWSVPAAPAQAFHHLFNRCCGRPATTTFYAPAVAVAPAPCPTPQVVSYMPQTAYRSVVVNRPVVSLMPTMACDPCGRATTVMRPVTTMVAQTQLVPYTTFRPVVTTVARPVCPSATVTSYAPAVTTVPAAPACCAPSAAPAYTPTPSLSSYAPAPAAAPVPLGTPGATLQSLPQTPTPSLNDSPYSPAPSGPGDRTFAPNGNSYNNDVNGGNPSGNNNGNGQHGLTPEPQSRMLLPPYSGSSRMVGDRPQGLDPDDYDRTTVIPLRQSMPVRQASLVVPHAEAQPVDDGGWRAGGR